MAWRPVFAVSTSKSALLIATDRGSLPVRVPSTTSIVFCFVIFELGSGYESGRIAPHSRKRWPINLKKFAQVRIIIEAPEENQGPPTNLNSYLTIVDDPTEYPLFVPSGSQTGLKISLQPALEVSVGQSFEITLDFNSENTIKKAGANDRYIIRPTSMSATISEL